MVVILLGDLMAHAQNLVEVGSKLEAGLVPTHHRLAEELTAENWDQVHKAENATIRTAQVRSILVSPDHYNIIDFFFFL